MITDSMETDPTRPAKPKVQVATELDCRCLHPVTALAYARLKKRMAGKQRVLAGGVFGIEVRPNNVDRAILIIDAVVCEFENRNLDVGSSAAGNGVAMSAPDQVTFTLKEDPETGTLALAWDGSPRGRKTWRDGSRRNVERQLGQFVESVEDAIATIKQNRIKAEKAEAERAWVCHRKSKRKGAAEAEQAMAEKVRKAMAAWEEAARLRKFADALCQAAAIGDIEVKTAIKWADFARGLADRVDPLVPEKPPELKTCDYMPFDEWHAEFTSHLDGERRCSEWTAKRLFEQRRTPEEAAAETDWGEYYW